MNFKIILDEQIKFINNELEKYIPTEDKYPQILFKAMRYSLFAGGKRIRPVMLLLTCEAFGGNKNTAVPFACAIEMIHTYSLIHDDLPAMDNDDYRRGRPTSHKVFGENIAILAGDALLHHAFEIMSDYSKNINDIKAINAIAKGAGIYGMVAGQTADVINDGKKIDIEILNYIHKNKTAVMICASLKAGGILGGASESEVEKLFEAGEKIGIAFQIQDDILDVISTFEELGKPIMSDSKNDKTTYVTIYGIEKSKEIVEKLSNEAIQIFKSMGSKTEILCSFTDYLIKRKY